MPAYKGGMISRAQAARVLGVSQVSVNRLIGRGYIRARHFPKEPDVEQVPVGNDDPFWHRMIGHLADFAGNPEDIAWYQACYVSLDDVVDLWEKGNQREVSRMNWKVFLPGQGDDPLYIGPHAERTKKQRSKK